MTRMRRLSLTRDDDIGTGLSKAQSERLADAAAAAADEHGLACESEHCIRTLINPTR